MVQKLKIYYDTNEVNQVDNYFSKTTLEKAKQKVFSKVAFSVFKSSK